MTLSARESDDLCRRTLRAVAVDSLVRRWTEGLVARGLGPITAAVCVTWAIERAQRERETRRERPA